MSKKPTKPGADAPFDPFKLPDLPSLPDIDDLPDVDAIMRDATSEAMPNPFDEIEDELGDNIEENSAKEDQLLDDKFAAVRAGRKQQQEAIALANETEYWCAIYFQSREQKEAFLQAMNWFQHGDKYLDGQWVAKKQGIALPPRAAPYKVGRLDKNLTKLT